MGFGDTDSLTAVEQAEVEAAGECYCCCLGRSVASER